MYSSNGRKKNSLKNFIYPIDDLTTSWTSDFENKNKIVLMPKLCEKIQAYVQENNN